MESDSSDFGVVDCLKPDSNTVIIEVEVNGELLAFEAGGN